MEKNTLHTTLEIIFSLFSADARGRRPYNFEDWSWRGRCLAIFKRNRNAARAGEAQQRKKKVKKKNKSCGVCVCVCIMVGARKPQRVPGLT